MTLLFMLRRLAEEDEEEGRAAGEDEGQGEGMLQLYVQSVGRPGHARGTTGFLHKAARSVFLAAWLVQGPAHESRVDHRDHGWPSRPDRIAARNRLKALPGAAELFSREAERRDGEASEPEGNP